jgi:hypothetical protein
MGVTRVNLLEVSGIELDEMRGLCCSTGRVKWSFEKLVFKVFLRVLNCRRLMYGR